MADQVRIVSVKTTRPRIARFNVTGTLDDGTRVTARFDNGAFDCDDALRRRADLIVAAGDSFELPERNHRRTATLSDDPVAIALTLIRAMRVDTFVIDFDGVSIRRTPGGEQ